MARGLAIVTAAATLVLILFGGLVTNTGAALAVPDWPTTFGYNMFLYPWSEMIGGIFYEHSHRLIGSVVGLLTLALAAALWRRGSTLRVLGVVAALAVVVQGLLGGMRVVLRQDVLAILHGCLAQAFFALLAVIVLLTSARTRAPLARIEPSTRNLALGAAAVAYVQIVLGALVTHAGIVDHHLVGAFAVFVIVPMLTARLRRSGDAVAAPLASVLLALLGVQRRHLSRALLIDVDSWRPGDDAGLARRPPPRRRPDPCRHRRPRRPGERNRRIKSRIRTRIESATRTPRRAESNRRFESHQQVGSNRDYKRSRHVPITLTHGASRSERSVNPIGTTNAAATYPSLSPTVRAGLRGSVK